MVSAFSMQYLNQLGGLVTFVEVENNKAKAYKLVPTTCWHNGQKFPHDIEKDLRAQSYRVLNKEGLDYFMVPESTTNSSGMVARYAQVDDYETPEPKDASPPPAVQKYLKSESRKIKRLG